MKRNKISKSLILQDAAGHDNKITCEISKDVFKISGQPKDVKSIIWGIIIFRELKAFLPTLIKWLFGHVFY